MKKKEIKEICEATFRHIYVFSKEDYKFVDWYISLDDSFDEYYVAALIVSKRHCVYRCSCYINKSGNINNEHCKALG